MVCVEVRDHFRHTQGPGIEPTVIRLGGKPLHSLSHLASPYLFFVCSLKDWCLVSSGRGVGVLSILQEAPFAKETITDTVKASKPGGRKHGGFRDWMPVWMSRAARHRHRQVEFECLFGIPSSAPVGRRVFWWVVVFYPLSLRAETPLVVPGWAPCAGRGVPRIRCTG